VRKKEKAREWCPGERTALRPYPTDVNSPSAMIQEMGEDCDPSLSSGQEQKEGKREATVQIPGREKETRKRLSTRPLGLRTHDIGVAGEGKGGEGEKGFPSGGGDAGG